MMKRFPALALLLSPILGGCAVGYNSTLFVTTSNIGLDVDTKPPTAEISIARREGVIAPTFEGGQTPPVLASFRTNEGPFARFFFGVKSTFAGGDAAVALAEGPNGQPVEEKDIPPLCLTKAPEKTVLGVDVSAYKNGTIEPFSFATDTTFGLKVAWSGTTAAYPDTVRLGFNRKEFAWAPIFEADPVQCNALHKQADTDGASAANNAGAPNDATSTQPDGTYAVRMPAFLAVLDNAAQVGAPSETGVTWLQYFATGTAATKLANLPEIRRVMLERIDPVAFETGTYDTSDPNVKCVDDWLKSDRSHAQELQSWWEEKKLPSFAALLIDDIKYKTERKAFIDAKGITCNP